MNAGIAHPQLFREARTILSLNAGSGGHRWRAGQLVTLSASTATGQFSHLRGLEKAIFAHKAEAGDVTALSAAQPGRTEPTDISQLTGLSRAIAAHKKNPNL